MIRQKQGFNNRFPMAVHILWQFLNDFSPTINSRHRQGLDVLPVTFFPTIILFKDEIEEEFIVTNRPSAKFHLFAGGQQSMALFNISSFPSVHFFCQCEPRFLVCTVLLHFFRVRAFVPRIDNSIGTLKNVDAMSDKWQTLCKITTNDVPLMQRVAIKVHQIFPTLGRIVNFRSVDQLLPVLLNLSVLAMFTSTKAAKFQTRTFFMHVS